MSECKMELNKKLVKSIYNTLCEVADYLEKYEDIDVDGFANKAMYLNFKVTEVMEKIDNELTKANKE